MSMAYSFADPPPRAKSTQYFENNGSRGIYPGRLVSPRHSGPDSLADGRLRDSPRGCDKDAGSSTT